MESNKRGAYIINKETNPPDPPLQKGGEKKYTLKKEIKEVVPSFFKGGLGWIYETDYITGCCLLIKREAIEKIGLLSEDYFLYYEDTDWNMRAQQVGYRCGIVPGAKIYHKGSASSTEFSYPYIYYHTRNGLIFGLRFGFLPLTYLISGWIFLKQLVKLAIGYRRQWARPVMRGVLDFWRGKVGKLEGYY